MDCFAAHPNDKPTLTPAALRMLTALWGDAKCHDVQKRTAEALETTHGTHWALNEIAHFNAVAAAAQEPNDKPTLTPAALRMLTALWGDEAANNIQKDIAEALETAYGARVGLGEIARYNAAAVAAQEPLT